MKKLLTTLAAATALVMPTTLAAADSAEANGRTVTRTVTTTTADGVTSVTTETIEECPRNKRDFKITPVGRILLDGAVYISHDKDFVDGVAVPDLRAGVKFEYGMWKAMVDVGYAFNKLSLKDVYIEADFNPNMLLRVGYFIHQFGLQSATSSSMKISMEEPTSNEAFNYPRQLGAMFVYDKGDYLGTFSAHTVSNLSMLNPANDLGRTRFGFMTRQVWRPLHQTGLTVQVGVSGAYDNPRADNEFTLASNFPTRVSPVSALSATLPQTRHIYRVTPDLLVNYGPVALETQYYWLHADRRNDLDGYSAYGAYALLRGLILSDGYQTGGNYKYDHASGGLKTPDAKSLELVLGYNYTNLSDNKIGVRGGRINDVSCTLNWYINKYMIWRLRYSYSHAWDRDQIPAIDMAAFQTRFQVIF